jgi:2-C-methyl-D-erythritol 4-phosphate cytidylyltransferase
MEKKRLGQERDGERSGMRAVALIAAAGRGRRMGAERPKVFLPLHGVPLLAHTLRRFEDCPSISEILPLVPEEEVRFCAGLVRESGFRKIPRVLAGGPERQDSVSIGLKAVSVADFVLVHDGARPFVSRALIEGLLREAERWGAVGAALPVADTLKEVSPEGEILQTLDRSRYWVMQTPQCFRYDLIARAHTQAREEGFSATDDAALVERMGVPVRVFPGSRLNIKIATPEDMILAEALFKHLP